MKKEGPEPWAAEIARYCLDSSRRSWVRLPHGGGWHDLTPQSEFELQAVSVVLRTMDLFSKSIAKWDPTDLKFFGWIEGKDEQRHTI